MGLIDTISLYGTAVLAIPIALLGVEFLVRGRTLAGVGFLALGLGLFAGRYYLPGVTDEAADAASSVVLGDADAESTATAEDDAGE